MNQTEPAPVASRGLPVAGPCSRWLEAILSYKHKFHLLHYVSYVSRMSRRACMSRGHACRAVLSDTRDTARHDFLLCQNSRATPWCDVPSGIWALPYRGRGRA